MNNKKLILGTAVLLCGVAALPTGVVRGQTAAHRSVMQTYSEGFFSRAEEMMRMGNYAGVIDQLGAALGDDSPMWGAAIGQTGVEDMRRKAVAMLLRAAYERGDEALFERYHALFLQDYNGSGMALGVELMQADFLFFKGEYTKAVRAYSDLDLNALDPALSALYKYRLGLSLVRTGYFAEAREIFTGLRTNHDYSEAAKFYLAYIDYVNGDLRSARRGFESVSGNMARELGTDYYIAQIDFQEGDFRTVTSRAAALLATARGEWVPEINRITGESYYNLGDRDLAERYLRDYVRAVDAPQLTALYDLGVIYYDRGLYDVAARYFSQLTSEGEAMAQSAYLYLGQLAAREGDYTAAALSFRNAYEMGIDPKVSETALYDYAVASGKGGQVPFGSSAALLEEFVERFPESPYAAKVDEYLATACFNDKDYAGALRHIERLRHPSAQALASKQKILFQLGAQAMGLKKYSEAAAYMKRAAAMSAEADRSLGAQASLWQGDALYALGDYPAATAAYTRFVKDSSRKDDNRALGLYNLGYSLYQEKKFTQARKRFGESLGARPALSARLASDARLRMADCDYYAGNVRSAMDTYASLASDSDNGEADYAAFQHANMLGTTGDYAGKARELEAMLRKYPDSRWADEARLELVNALCGAGDIKGAASESAALLRLSPDSPQTRRAALAVAAAWQEADRDKEAKAAYMDLVRRWPTSSEAESGVGALRTLFSDEGDMQGFLSFLDSVPQAPRPDASEMESIAFDSALRRMERNPGDTAPMEEYLDKYPTGANADRALLAMAEARRDAGDNAAALASVERLLSSRPDSESVPAALMFKGELLESDGNDAAASVVWRQLLERGGALYAPVAYAGLMRTSVNPSEVVTYADRVLSLNDADGDTIAEAILAKGGALRALGRNAEAVAALAPLAAEPSTEAGAEAAVMTGEILLAEKDAKGAEKHLLAFIDSDTPQVYWLARGYIALADAYHALGNDYKAKEYLKALKSNYPGNEADIKEMISSRLSKY